MPPKPRSRSSPPPRAIGVDTGGTFTDLVLLERGGTRVAKLSSTPADPARAVLDGLAALGGADAASHVIHGTTVALNALLTGRVARTALVTNRGFRDLIEIGRQDRPELYALHPIKPAPLVPRELRFEVGQRSWPDPDDPRAAPVEVERPGADELRALARRLARARPESVAVCLLHAWADPSIEETVAEALAGLDLPITRSAAVLREYREVERFSSAIVNAALVPRMREYLAGLEPRLGGARLSLLQSSGGTMPAEQAAEEPVRVLFSGPAGGVMGAARAAREAGLERIVGLDMGGTSTDVAFHDAARGSAVLAGPARVAGHPVAVPALDIHTVGCGGGSLVRVDAGGVLHVGPESAGASPGPVCYGEGDELTVTDAHVMLGHVREGSFLDGGLPLDVDAVRKGFERLGRKLGTRPAGVARGVLEVARASMRRAVGVMTMQRGQDPRGLTLVAFGGAGGMHAAALAESLDMPRALVPAHPGLLSAWGMATADALREVSRSVLAPLSGWSATRRRRALAELAREARERLSASGGDARAVELEHELDLRYVGQSYELRVVEGRAPERTFHLRHAELYGYDLPDRPVELVNLRVRAIQRGRRVRRATVRSRPLPRSARTGTRRAWLGRSVSAAVVERARLEPGHRFGGPALVEEYSGTTLVPPDWKARVTAGGHLLLERP